MENTENNVTQKEIKVTTTSARSSGRPVGSKTDPKKKKLNQEKRIQKLAKALANETRLYTCSRCARQTPEPSGIFYMVRSSELNAGNDWYGSVCSKCVKEMYEDLKIRYKDEKLAFIVICHYINVYYDDKLFNAMVTNTDFGVGTYLRALNVGTGKNKSFVHYLTDILKELDVKKSMSEIRALKEPKWENDDKENKDLCYFIAGCNIKGKQHRSLTQRCVLNNLVNCWKPLRAS